MDTTYPVITQTYTPEETSRISSTREVLPQVSYFKNIELYIPPEIVNEFTLPLRLTKGSSMTGAIAHRRRTFTSTETNDLEIRSVQGEYSDTITYATLATYGNSSTITNTQIPTNKRDAFLQIYISRLNGAFREAQMNFSLQGQSGTFVVTVTNSSGGGHVLFPRLAADPADGAGLMYYNTATNKFRICDGGGWKNL